MWVEKLTLENIRCFEKANLTFSSEKQQPYRWITFLGENGGGKSTALQALGLLLAGTNNAQQLTRPLGWVRHEEQVGKILTRIHQGNRDPGEYRHEGKIEPSFEYTYFITGNQPITIENKQFTEPTLVANQNPCLTWLNQNAFRANGTGWFAAGYGAFRRLTRASQMIIPSLETPSRINNFSTQFDEDHPLATFERWMVYLDYRIVKSNDMEAKHQRELGIMAINQILPEGITFDSVTPEGRILFDMAGRKVPTIALSEGYRNVLALVGDLIWRLLLTFPDSHAPLQEEGVVLIDELDIHLHPIWQRHIAIKLQEQFPNLQFIVATHSPLIAAGAGINALTYRFVFHDGKTYVTKIDNIASWNVDRILQSEAFGLVSPFSPQTQASIDRYDTLLQKPQRTEEEEKELTEALIPIIQRVFPLGRGFAPGSLEARITDFLNNTLK